MATRSILASSDVLRCCLIPSFDGAFLSHDSKHALWDCLTRLRHHDRGSPSREMFRSLLNYVGPTLPEWMLRGARTWATDLIVMRSW